MRMLTSVCKLCGEEQSICNFKIEGDNIDNIHAAGYCCWCKVYLTKDTYSQEDVTEIVAKIRHNWCQQCPHQLCH